MFLPADIPAGLILFPLKVCPFAFRDFPIGLGASFGSSDLALPGLQLRGLDPVYFTGSDAFLHTRPLILLSLIHYRSTLCMRHHGTEQNEQRTKNYLFHN